MDSYREHPSDFDLPAAEASAADVAAAIGTDERRMHVRAYNYWVSLLNGRDYPSIEDLEPGSVSDFADHSVLLDFTAGGENPATPYVGGAVRAECGVGDDIKTIADVPSRSLLSRLTDHYMQIIANRAPVGFEAEFENQRGVSICYRGILMPFSSDGDTIDFIYGVINWKAAEGERVEPQPADLAAEVPFAPEPDEEESAPPILELADALSSEEGEAPHLSWEDGPLADPEIAIELPEIRLDETAGLADWLCAARETADAVKASDQRSRVALYRALSQAYDFALATERAPDDYAELLDESGVKPQARAPMTPVVKLVFGIDYDKTRLTEFAAALSFALRQPVETGGFQDFIEKTPGGLKALVAAERQARRPEPKSDTRAERGRARLRSAAPLPLAALPLEDEFCLVLTRRSDSGEHQPVARVDDPALLDRAIRRSASL